MKSKFTSKLPPCLQNSTALPGHVSIPHPQILIATLYVLNLLPPKAPHVHSHHLIPPTLRFPLPSSSCTNHQRQKMLLPAPRVHIIGALPLPPVFKLRFPLLNIFSRDGVRDLFAPRGIASLKSRVVDSVREHQAQVMEGRKAGANDSDILLAEGGERFSDGEMRARICRTQNRYLYNRYRSRGMNKEHRDKNAMVPTYTTVSIMLPFQTSLL
jgi:hypothetical protein